MKRTGEPANEEEVWMNPFAKFWFNHMHNTLSSERDSEYCGPKEGVVPSFRGIVWSMGQCGGSLLASISEKSDWKSWYSFGISEQFVFSIELSIMSMSAIVIANVDAFSYNRFSFFAIFQNAVKETAAILVVLGWVGGGSMALIFIVVWEQVVLHNMELNSIVPVALRMVGSWCCSHGIPRTRG